MSEAAAKPAIDPYAVLQKVADGCSLRDAANDLHTSYGYLKMRLKRHYDDVGAEYLAHAVAIAFRAGKVT